ncbi:MAG: TMEM43 family protein [Gammaproteobacteria bacterium]
MVQVVTTKSWGSRIVGAFAGILFGIALIIGSFVLVFWNEGHGLHTAQSLEQADKVLVSVPNAPVNPANDMKVVYFSGQATTKDQLSDPLFHVSVNAINLQRHVEMYQWQENSSTQTQDQTGGGQTQTTTYTYQQVWSDHVIDSSNFKEPDGHQNPTSMPISSQIQYAQTVTVGGYNLPSDLIQQITGSTPIDLSNTNLELLKTKLNKPIQHNGDGLYVGTNPDVPAIGDLKMSLTEVLPQVVSIIAQQNNNTVQAYAAPAGETVMLLEMGQQSPDAMIQHALSQNQMLTWILRGVALLLMIIGLALLMQPMVVLADFFPFFGSIVGVGTGLIAFAGGLMLWSMATAIAWFTIRPLWAIGLIVIAVLIGTTLIHRRKLKQVPKSAV